MAAVQEDARASAPVEVRVVFLVALNRKVFDAGACDAIAADDRKRGCRAGVSGNEIVTQHGLAGAECITVRPDQRTDDGVKSARVVVRYADPDTWRETRRVGNRDLFLAVVPVERERAFDGIRLEENGFRPLDRGR